ncbi:hypothetical protein RN001_005625 [Aquatica leii]|uniref:Myb/SANT-like DNA-binding domain-containing protein n=1 Tax=Aquatica leii TaxID=1421715 RepID=A0AAN7PK53_9COLE|nr:hypothetical protein RN001_005625 [Aquatica leii]
MAKAKLRLSRSRRSIKIRTKNAATSRLKTLLSDGLSNISFKSMENNTMSVNSDVNENDNTILINTDNTKSTDAAENYVEAMVEDINYDELTYNIETDHKRTHNFKITGRRIVDINFLLNQLQSLKHDGFGCTFFDMHVVSEKLESLHSLLLFKCSVCNLKQTITTGKSKELNLAVVAGTLVTDPETAAEYIKKNYVVTAEDSADVGHEDNVEECSKENTEEIWSSKKPTNRDNLATECFLKLRYALTEKFVDKKNNKGKLWAQVAASMEQKGFKLGSNGSERCRQKFANLQKMYFGYIRGHVKKTGTEKKEEPMFYELMHAILGDKDKTNPKCLLDSDERPDVTKQKDAVLQSCTQNYATHSASTSTSTDEDTTGPSTPQSHNIKSRFSRDRTPLKPQSNVNQIINCLKNELGKDRDDRTETI